MLGPLLQIHGPVYEHSEYIARVCAAQLVYLPINGSSRDAAVGYRTWDGPMNCCKLSSGGLKVTGSPCRTLPPKIAEFCNSSDSFSAPCMDSYSCLAHKPCPRGCSSKSAAKDCQRGTLPALHTGSWSLRGCMPAALNSYAYSPRYSLASRTYGNCSLAGGTATSVLLHSPKPSSVQLHTKEGDSFRLILNRSDAPGSTQRRTHTTQQKYDILLTFTF